MITPGSVSSVPSLRDASRAGASRPIALALPDDAAPPVLDVVATPAARGEPPQTPAGGSSDLASNFGSGGDSLALTRKQRRQRPAEALPAQEDSSAEALIQSGVNELKAGLASAVAPAARKAPPSASVVAKAPPTATSTPLAASLRSNASQSPAVTVAPVASTRIAAAPLAQVDATFVNSRVARPSGLAHKHARLPSSPPDYRPLPSKHRNIAGFILKQHSGGDPSFSSAYNDLTGVHRPSSDAAKDRHEHDELSQLRMHASGDAPANDLKLPRFSEAKEDEGYFCEPSVAKMQTMSLSELRQVRLTIGRKCVSPLRDFARTTLSAPAYESDEDEDEDPGDLLVGKIVWDCVDVTELEHLDLGAAVVIEGPGKTGTASVVPSVEVYPHGFEDATGQPYPQVGYQLNRPARVTLQRVQKLDRATREPTDDETAIAQYERRLGQYCKKHGLSMINYSHVKGTWCFQACHFSRYSAPAMDLGSDSDEDDDTGAGQPAANAGTTAVYAPQMEESSSEDEDEDEDADSNDADNDFYESRPDAEMGPQHASLLVGADPVYHNQAAYGHAAAAHFPYMQMGGAQQYDQMALEEFMPPPYENHVETYAAPLDEAMNEEAAAAAGGDGVLSGLELRAQMASRSSVKTRVRQHSLNRFARQREPRGRMDAVSTTQSEPTNDSSVSAQQARALRLHSGARRVSWGSGDFGSRDSRRGHLLLRAGLAMPKGAAAIVHVDRVVSCFHTGGGAGNKSSGDGSLLLGKLMETYKARWWDCAAGQRTPAGDFDGRLAGLEEVCVSSGGVNNDNGGDHRAEYGSDTFSLMRTLWGAVPGPHSSVEDNPIQQTLLSYGLSADHPELDNQAFERAFRYMGLRGWLQTVARRASADGPSSQPSDPLDSVLDHISCGDIDGAAEEAQRKKLHVLSLFLVTIHSNLDSRSELSMDMRREMKKWANPANTSIDHRRMLSLYQLLSLSQDVCNVSIVSILGMSSPRSAWEGSPAAERMDWIRSMIIHGDLTEDSIATKSVQWLVDRYELCCGPGPDKDLLARPLHLHLRERKDKVCANRGNQLDEQRLDTRFRLLQLFSKNQKSAAQSGELVDVLRKGLEPRNQMPCALDALLSWLIVELLCLEPTDCEPSRLPALQTTPICPSPLQPLREHLASSLISQLESEGMWEWAVFMATATGTDLSFERCVRHLSARQSVDLITVASTAAGPSFGSFSFPLVTNSSVAVSDDLRSTVAWSIIARNVNPTTEISFKENWIMQNLGREPLLVVMLWRAKAERAHYLGDHIAAYQCWMQSAKIAGVDHSSALLQAQQMLTRHMLPSGLFAGFLDLVAGANWATGDGHCANHANSVIAEIVELEAQLDEASWCLFGTIYKLFCHLVIHVIDGNEEQAVLNELLQSLSSPQLEAHLQSPFANPVQENYILRTINSHCIARVLRLAEQSQISAPLSATVWQLLLSSQQPCTTAFRFVSHNDAQQLLSAPGLLAATTGL